MKKVFSLIMLAMMAGSVYAGPGTTGLEFLSYGVGARAIGMGEAFTGLANDVSAGYWNPAGLTQLGDMELLVMYDSMALGLSHMYVGFGKKLDPKKNSVIGAQIKTYSTPSDQGYDVNGNKADSWSSSGNGIILSYATQVGEKSFIGGNLKMVSQTIWKYSGSGFGVDAGFLNYPSDKVSLGLAVQNAGSGIKFISETTSLPLTIRAGANYKVMEDEQNSASLGADIVSKGGTAGLGLGGEYVISHMLALRAGILAVTSIPTIGVGLYQKDFTLDVAIVMDSALESSTKLSLIMKFGKVSKKTAVTKVKEKDSLDELKKQLAEAKANDDLEKAIQLKERIKALEAQGASSAELEQLKKLYEEAKANDELEKAAQLKEKIKALEGQGKSKEDINELKKQWEEAIGSKDYKKAEEIDQKMKALESK